MSIQINPNPNFGYHNTSRRKNGIRYIVIHYVGATGDARNNINYYSQPDVTSASADFYVGFAGDIWQYNMDVSGRYSWAIGGSKLNSQGGSLYGVAVNANSVSIEMCVRNNTSDRNPNSRGWYFEKATVDGTVMLTRHLMQQYKVPAERVIRHYDVTGKFCPGVYGWNPESGSESAWIDFKARIEDGDQTGAESGNSQSGGNAYMFSCRQIQIGDSGNDILLLQEILGARGFYPGALDKSFGPQLDAALRDYQKVRNLSVDGICGPNSWKDLIAL